MVKNQPVVAGDARYMGLTPGLGRSPGEENGNPLQNSCLEDSKAREAWQSLVRPWDGKELDMTALLNTYILILYF